MSIKTERLANLLVKEISSILMTEIKDEDIKFVTITHLDLSSDLSYAKVYCTVLNDENRDKCIHDLNGAKGFIRSELMKRKLEMRKIPELHFVFDESIDYGNKIEKIIKEIHENDYISAGCEMQINNKKYYLIVKGDINGDGKVTGTDLVKVRRYLIGLETFTPVEKVGAILSQRNDVSINDLAKMRKIILQ